MFMFSFKYMHTSSIFCIMHCEEIVLSLLITVQDAAMAVAAMDFAQKSGSSGIGSKQEGSMHSLQEPGHCLKQRSGRLMARSLDHILFFFYLKQR